MEVGAVKQAFNNEIIMLKNKLNQAKIQIIHKLTRKAKTLVEKKTPDPLKEKLKRKAESAVNEVLIIKKIKPRDIAKFVVAHTGELKTFLNRPKVDIDKACARLLLHKSLQDKYKLIRNKFSNIPIDDLLMSRLERRKLKKEEKEAQKAKKNAKLNKRVVKDDHWDVEDVRVKGSVKVAKNDLGNEEMSDELQDSDDERSDESEHASNEEINSNESNGSDDDGNEEQSDVESENDQQRVSDDHNKEVVKAILDTAKKSNNDNTDKTNKKPEKSIRPIKNDVKPKKQKNRNKNDNLGEKLLLRKSKKEETVEQTMVVDPFFITSTGENYVSVAEPRKPDEIKAEHRQGNRQYRRAVMFGHEPKVKPRRDNFRQDGNRFNGHNGWDKNGAARNKFNNRRGPSNRHDNNDRNNFRDRSQNNNIEDPKPEKLHPSWEAKKKQSGIQPFQGKKIVFDES